MQIKFYGIFYKNKCMDVIRWRPEVAKQMGQTSEPRSWHFNWQAGNKTKFEIKEVEITAKEN